MNQVLLKQKRKKDEVATLEMQLKETQKQNAVLQRQLSAQMSANNSQQQEASVTSVTIQHIHHHHSNTPQQPVYPVLPQPQQQPQAPKPNIQQEKEETASHSVIYPSAPKMDDDHPPNYKDLSQTGVTNRGYQP